MNVNWKMPPRRKGLVKIDNWSICDFNYLGKRFALPEMFDVMLCGNAYNHPELYDGEAMVTSKIVEIKARKVWTSSGTQYVFGRIDPEYRWWLKANYPNWNWRRPILAKR
jgi:hypothetical protein